MPVSDFGLRLGDRIGLAEKRRRLMRFHWVEMEILEILASWSETMVYIPVRVGIGRAVWEQALNCDQLGWALRNLKHMGRVVAARAPSDEFVRYCEQLHGTTDPARRLVAMFRVLVPALAAAQRTYLDATDRFADGNAVEALDQCLRRHADQQYWADLMLSSLVTTSTALREAAELEHSQRLALIAAGGVDADGAAAYFVPYQGWPESDEAVAARIEVPTGTGQWQTSGYRYKKDFERGIIHLRWDSRFRYAESAAELEEKPPPGTPVALVHYLHGLFHGECHGADRTCWLIVDFPDLPWGLRKDMAQQAWEEARHAQIVAQLIEGLGGRLGQHPFSPYFLHLRRDFHHPVTPW